MFRKLWPEYPPECRYHHERGVGEEREAKLMRDIFFKPALENGVQMARRKDTIRSAKDILRP